MNAQPTSPNCVRRNAQKWSSKAEFIRKLEALHDKHTELAHLAAEPVRDAPPLFRRKPPVQ
jgi:hypothetical protein